MRNKGIENTDGTVGDRYPQMPFGKSTPDLPRQPCPATLIPVQLLNQTKEGRLL